MKKLNKLLFVLVIGIFAFTVNVSAKEKNEVTLNFEDGVIHDGYVEYDGLGTVQLFKDDKLVIDIENEMKIDLNEANYQLQVKGSILVEDPDNIYREKRVAAIVNDWYYGLTQNSATINLDTNKYNGTVNIKLIEYTGVLINTRVENVYSDITSTGIIDLTRGYVIDFSKDDQLTSGLRLFADLEKTLYYKNVNGSLALTENEEEAIIKIVGNKSENKAIMTVVNAGNKINETFKGLYTKYTGSKLQYDSTEANVINETRTDYYTKCTYDFIFKYSKIVYDVIEGNNQKYIISKNDIMSFRIDADYSLFENGGKVYIDDVLVDSSNYTSESGSTIITFSENYVSSLTAGLHTLKVVFNDEGEATTNFTIENIIPGIENPNTGDNILTYFVLSILSVLGIAVTVVINSKKKREN